jgi:hypothetical protein
MFDCAYKYKILWNESINDYVIIFKKNHLIS